MNKGTSLHGGEDKRRGGKVDLSGHRNTVGPLCSLTCASGGRQPAPALRGRSLIEPGAALELTCTWPPSSFVT